MSPARELKNHSSAHHRLGAKSKPQEPVSQAAAEMTSVQPLRVNLLEFLPTLHPSQRLALGCLRRHRRLTRREICTAMQWEPATTSRLLRPLLDCGLLFSPSLQSNDNGRSQ